MYIFLERNHEAHFSVDAPSLDSSCIKLIWCGIIIPKGTNGTGEQSQLRLSTRERALTHLPILRNIIARDKDPRASLFFFSRLAQLDVATAAGSRRKDSGAAHRDASANATWTTLPCMHICKLVASEIRGWCGTDSVGTPSGQSQLPRHPRIYSRDENPQTITSWTMDVRASRFISTEGRLSRREYFDESEYALDPSVHHAIAREKCVWQKILCLK